MNGFASERLGFSIVGVGGLGDGSKESLTGVRARGRGGGRGGGRAVEGVDEGDTREGDPGDGVVESRG